MKKLDFENTLKYINERISHLKGCIDYCLAQGVPEVTTQGYYNELHMFEALHVMVSMMIGQLYGSICNDKKCKLFAMDGEDEDAYMINVSELAYFVTKEEFELMKPFMKKVVDERK
ncbi:MAG: hypothetical protein J6T10_13480 [Methanobrevibacter sp.]|nr:hypothetical protein [Methanobrevibacter sp.]